MHTNHPASTRAHGDRYRRQKPRRLAALAAAVFVAPVVALSAPAGADGVAQIVVEPDLACDFDADDHEDLAIGAPERAVAGIDDAGAIFVYEGSESLPDGADGTIRSQGDLTGGLVEVAAFGASMACGDINGDGFSDLVVGAPDTWSGGAERSGAIHVLFGHHGGLSGASQVVSQATPGIGGTPEFSDRFGSAVETGDFDGDGFADVAVSARGENGGAGAVHVIYGSGAGLTHIGDRVLMQSNPAIPGAVEPGDAFGYALAAGDFDGDGYDDLAAGAPGEGIGAIDGAGVVHVFPGSASGIDLGGDTVWHQNTPGVPGGVEPFDGFGFALAAGDIDDDGRDDLAIGVPGEGIGATLQAGAVTVLYGTTGGVSASGAQAFSQNTAGVPGVAEVGDTFGRSVLLADLDGDDHAELVVGTPGEDLGPISDAGMAHAFRNDGDVVVTTNIKTYTQNVMHLGGGPEAGDLFGWSFASLALSDGRDFLLIGAPGENLENLGGGLVHITTMPSPGGPTLSDGFSEAPLPEGIQDSFFGASVSD